MKRNHKRFLALCLSASMLASPLSYTRAYASDENGVVESDEQKEAVADTEGQTENQNPATEENGNTSGQENAETDGTQDSEQNKNNAVSGHQALEENQVREAVEQSAESSAESTETPVIPTIAITGMKVLKNDGVSEYKMFPINITKMETTGDTIRISFNTDGKKTFNRLYLGSYTDETKAQVFTGTNTGSTVEFTIQVPAAKKNSWIPITLGKSDGNSWKEEFLWMSIPDPSAPAITEQPKAQTVKKGETVTLQVAASGDELSYQWQYSTDGSAWTDCAGEDAKKAAYTFKMSADLAGRYRCVVKNQLGAEVISEIAKVSLQEESGKDDSGSTEEIPDDYFVNDGIKAIYASDDAKKAGQSYTMFKIAFSKAVAKNGKIEVTLWVKAAGSGNFSYQYIYIGNRNDESKEPVVTPVVENNLQKYVFSVSGDMAGKEIHFVPFSASKKEWSTSSSLAFKLPDSSEFKKPSVITVTTQPKDTSVKMNKNVTLSVAAESDDKDALSYQWQYSVDGSAWTDCNEISARSSEYTFTLTDQTIGQYRCVISDTKGGQIESDVAHVQELKAPAVTGSKVRVVKADGTDFKMFVVSESKVQKDGDMLDVTFETANPSFDKVYLGEKEDEIKQAVKGKQVEKNAQLVWRFTLQVPEKDMGKVLPVTLGKVDSTEWYTGQDLWIYIPDEGVTDIPVSEDEVKAIAGGTGALYSDFAVVSSKAVLRGDNVTMTLNVKGNKWTKLYQGVQADKDKTVTAAGIYNADENITTFTFAVPASKQGMNIAVTPGNDSGWFTYARDLFINVPNLKGRGYTTANGTYDLYGSAYPVSSSISLNFERESKVVINGESATVTMVTQSSSYDKLYIGNVDDSDKDSKAVTAVDRSDIASGYKSYTFVIPTADLGKEISYAVYESKKGKWSEKQGTFYINGILEKIEDTPTPDPEPDPTPVIPADGIYTIDVESSASMFRVVACTLTVKNGKMTAVLTLSGTGYDYLYMGTEKEVATADSSTWIPYKDVNGQYTYEIPVEALDKGIAVAAFSHKNQKWYDRTLTFKSETLQKVNDSSTMPTTPGKPSGGSSSSSGVSKPNDGKADKESKWEADTSGSTATVNSSTTLADGVYTPDRFSWSGGTGKVKITCNKVTITNGQAYATLVFDSDHYQYVKANGRQYNTTKGDGTATVVIPIALNQNNTILAMTDKMSVAHEIAYTIFVYLAAAGNGKGDGTVQNKTLDKEAPEIMGLEYKSETKIDHAEYFKIYQYDKGITLLEIDMTKDTVRDLEKQEDSTKEDTAKEDEKVSEAADSAEDGDVAVSEEEQAAELYKGNVVKYLLVPEDTVIPVGLSEDMIVVQMPADKIYASDNAILKQLEDFDLLDQVAAVGMKKKNCKVDAIADKMTKKDDEKQADVIYGGKESDPKYRELVKQEVNLALVSADLLPGEEKKTKKGKTVTEEEQLEQWEKITEKYALLGIPMIVDRSAEEKDDLAKAEWLKVYGVIFGCEEQAEKLYEQAVEQAGEK